MRRSRLVPWLAALVLALWTGSASAHAFLMETVPEDSTVLDAPPSEVRLRFNEAVTPLKVELHDAAGRLRSGADAWTVAGDTVSLPVPGDLETGAYRVEFRVASADGHPAAGAIAFGIGVAPQAVATPNDEAPEGVAMAAVALRGLHWLALLAALGGGVFLVLVPGIGHPVAARVRPGLATLAGIAGWTAVALVGVSGAVLDGGGFGSLLAARPWQVGASGTAALAAAVALLAALTGLSGLTLRPGRPAAGLVLAGGLLAAMSLAVTGHAGTAPPRWLSMPLVVLHGAAAAFWIGALWPLAVILRGCETAEAARLIRKFSTLALGTVALLLAAGIGLSALQLRALGAVTATAYGGVWLTKMAAVGGLLALAAWNRLVATPRLARGRAGAAAALRRSIRAELGLVAAILLLTASFALTPPPRSLPGFAEAEPVPEPAPGYTAVAVAGGVTAILDVTPARIGRNRVALHLSGTDGRPAPDIPAEWSVAGGEPRRLTLAADAYGRMMAEIDVPASGRWTMRLRLPWPDAPSAIILTVPIPSATDAGSGARP